MHNVSHVCFACRRVMRRPAHEVQVAPCSSCGGPAERIGDRVPVPPRDNLRAWAAFEESWREVQEERASERLRRQVRTRHAIEHRIADLMARDGDPKGREVELRMLRRRLAGEFPGTEAPGN